ncbi:adenine-specific methyltransferase EcoRI family protein [Streptococcus sciuri]|uniref:Adenine-specific methyltransferase EcoRI family protein n=1 Tax=Streptococcus sciuri TaxID=2973939 RepID=A0ABT2F5D2_9STRE|nr:adenine-specific methyltransferase EcoRI family protein [Streptococcus sciuri]MCS4487595.1 adenine-specific methyltransferase EcoRI family protein [Streptococcus sciuri]
MAGNNSLTRAKADKEDEFYTQISDIEKELKHYTSHFKGKHVFCNCDDPEESSFWRYFTLNFKRLGLSRLTSTHYMENGQSYRLDIYKNVPDEAKNKPTFLTLEGSNIDLPLGYITNLEGDGDFRSDESIAILKECDIVVTNPPFSLFREFIAQLFKYQKDFLIIGNQNAITYKEIFGYLQSKQMWLGANYGDMAFKVPAHYEPRKTRFWIDETGQKWRSLGNICWFTNLDFKQRHEELILYKSYTPEEYPEYDNYHAINIDKVAEIPFDYDGVMGVPITFMCKYNPEQFEIIWTTDRGGDGQLEKIKKPHSRYDAPIINGNGKYKRIIIKRKASK